MDAAAIERALHRLGTRFAYPIDVELLLVGGAAGMLSGVLPRSRTTIDCDVMLASPDEALGPLEDAARAMASELGLPSSWLNSDVQLRRDALPRDWRSRRVWLGMWGRLRVFSIGRSDLAAMKVLAGRPQDVEDLRALRLTRDDVDFVRRYLGTLATGGTHDDEIREASALLAILEEECRGR